MDDAMDMDSEDLEEETEAEIDKVGRNQPPLCCVQNTVWMLFILAHRAPQAVLGAVTQHMLDPLLEAWTHP